MIAHLTDQAVYSLTNFLLLLLALRNLELTQVGLFTLLYYAVLTVVATGRAGLFEPMLTSALDWSRAQRIEATRSAAGAALALGLGVTALMTVGATALRQPPTLVVCCGAVLTLMMVQDAFRYHWFAAGQPWQVAINDTLCLLGTVATLGLLSAAGQLDLVPLMLAWAAGAAIGIAGAIPVVRAVPSLRNAWRWARANRHAGLPLAGAVLVGMLGMQLSLTVTGAIGGLTALGLLSAAIALLAPLNVLIAATGIYGVTDAARRLRRAGIPDLRRGLLRIGVGLTFAIAALPPLYFVVPDRVGERYFGDNWSSSSSCLFPIAIWLCLHAGMHAPRCALRVLGRDRTALALSAVTSALQASGAAAGAALGGGQGAAWGMAAANATMILPWLLTFHRVAGRAEPRIPRPRTDQRYLEMLVDAPAASSSVGDHHSPVVRRGATAAELTQTGRPTTEH
ncbi:MAG: hypothetical protein H0V07_11785 [Propionibacteriales bacterium]|nr:hypothetical protein [Propionibacteriales bacterium]